MNKISNNLKTKMANYSLLAGAALTMLAACGKDDKEDNDPNIIETDVNPDISLTPGTNVALNSNIDFNNDGIIDVVVNAYNNSYTYGGYTNTSSYSYLSTGNGAEFLTTSESETVSGYTYTFDVARGLSAGNSISASEATWLTEAILGLKGTYYGQDFSVGQFLGADKFVGVRFTAAGNTHYAWLKIGISANGNSVTVKEYAYHATPNTAIIAGAK